jgi:hypothetical protein
MNFDELTTVSDWSEALRELVALATSAVQRNDADEMLKIQELLLAFQEQSPPSFNSLDAIAARTSIELNRTSRDIILANLSSLSRELLNLSQLMGVAAEHALLRSDAIQLKNTKSFLSKAKASLQILTGLRDDLNDSSTNLGRKVDAVFNAINDFETAFA